VREYISADEYLNLILDLNNAANRADTSKKVFELFKTINSVTCKIDRLIQLRLLDIYMKDTEIYTRKYKHLCDWGYKSNDYFGSVADVLRKVHEMLLCIRDDVDVTRLILEDKGVFVEQKTIESESEPESVSIHSNQGSVETRRATQFTFAF
jgi:hypothetical protein